MLPELLYGLSLHLPWATQCCQPMVCDDSAAATAVVDVA
jgi:hypothetical protein